MFPSNSSRVSFSARAAPSAMVSRLFPHACFMESERSSKNTTQPGSLRLISLSYIAYPPFLGRGRPRFPAPPGHDPDRRPRRTRLPGPDVFAGLTVEIPAVRRPPGIEPERAAPRALRDKGRGQVGGQVRRGGPLGG